MRETKISKPLPSQVGSLMYNFRRERKKVYYRSNENCHK